MISNTILESHSVLSLLSNLNGDGLTVRPSCEGPLNELVTISTNGLHAAFTRFETSADTTHFIELFRDRLTPNNKMIQSAMVARDHQAVMDESVKLVSKVMANTLDLTQRLVLPLIEEILVNMEDYLNNEHLGRAIALNITEVVYNEIWSSNELQGLVAKYDRSFNQSMSDINLRRLGIHADRSTDEILDLCLTGSTGLDTLIKAWLEKHKDIVVEVYLVNFADGTTSQEWLTTDIVAKDRVLAYFLLARGLSKNIGDNINLTLNEYNALMSNAVHGSGNLVKHHMSARNANFNQDTLVLHYPKSGLEASRSRANEAVILVNPDVYKKYLEEGGTPESIMGSYLSDRVKTVSALLENAVEYERQWNIRANVILRDSKHIKDSNIRRVLQENITKVINNSEDEIYTRFTKASMHSLLAEKVHDINNISIHNLETIVTDVVCDVLFADTEVRTLIREMKEISNAEPDLEPSEVATIAIIEMVTNWIVSQMIVEKVA